MAAVPLLDRYRVTEKDRVIVAEMMPFAFNLPATAA